MKTSVGFALLLLLGLSQAANAQTAPDANATPAQGLPPRALQDGGLGAIADASVGQILPKEFNSPILNREWRYEVYLPVGYDGGTRRYPVIYLLHGNYDDQTTWRVKANIGPMTDDLIARGLMQPTIIVMPSGRRSWYVNGPEKMESAFIIDLVPEIDRRFRTIPDRQSRGIAGLSMGGYGAMRLALLHTDDFSAVALMSPAIYAPVPPPNSSAVTAPAFEVDGVFDASRWEAMNYPALLDNFVRSGWKLRVQLTAGSEDKFGTGDAAAKFAAALKAHGVGADLAMYPGGHDFALWRVTLPMALRFLAAPPRVANAGQ